MAKCPDSKRMKLLPPLYLYLFLFRRVFLSPIVHSKIDPDCKLEQSINGFYVQLIFYKASTFNSQRMRRNRPNKSPENHRCSKSVADATFSKFATLAQFLKISGQR